MLVCTECFWRGDVYGVITKISKGWEVEESVCPMCGGEQLMNLDEQDWRDWRDDCANFARDVESEG